MTPVAFRARLVRAARNDRPSRETAERVLAAALLVSLETCATPPPRALSAVRDLLRRLLVPLSVVTLAGDPSPPVRPFPPSSAASAAPIVSAAPPPSAPAPAPPPSAPAPAPAPVVLSSPPVAPPSPVPSQAPSELALLRRAKASLPADPAAAFAALSAHARLHPHGVLREEAEALRIDALFASNDREATRAAALRFLATHPRSPYTQRVQTVATRTAAPAPAVVPAQEE